MRKLPIIFWLVLSGLLMSLSQLAAPLWPLMLGGLALFLFFLGRLSDWRSVIFAGLLVGTLKAAGGFAWIWHAYPLVWLDIDNAVLQLLLIGLYWVTTSIFMGAGIVLPAAVFHYLRQRVWWLLAIFPFVWVAGEVLGSLLVSVWLLGPGAYLHAYIGHGYAGLPLAQLDWLLPITDLAGLYGLTWVTVWFGLLLALLLLRPSETLSGVLAASVVALLISNFVWTSESYEIETQVVAIDTNFTSASLQTPEGRQLKSREVLSAVQAALMPAPSYPDIILLPEDSRLTTWFSGPENTLAYLKELAPDSNTIVVDSARVEVEGGKVSLRAYYYDLGANAIYMTDKQFLVPQGEYISYPFRFMLAALGQSDLFAQIDQNQNYVPGPINDYDNVPIHVPAILFCSESSSAIGVFKATKAHDSQFILHPLSHGRFNNSWILNYQLSAMLRAQAVWNDVTIVTAANMAEGKLYGPDGGIESGVTARGTAYWSLIKHGR